MNNKFKDIGIAYFTNPPILNEPFGKEVDGIMVSVAKQVPVRKIDTYKEVTIVEALKPENLPSLIFTNDQGNKTYLKIEGTQLNGISVERVIQTVESIHNQNG